MITMKAMMVITSMPEKIVDHDSDEEELNILISIQREA
jgi:hypothetical protein